MAAERRPMAARRTEIADAVLRIIGSRGISELTMATIAAEIGVTSGALFRHFASRDEMLDEAAKRAEELLLATFPPADLAPMERLEKFLQSRTRAVGANAGLARLMLSEQFALALPPESAARLRALVARTREFMVHALRDAATRKEIRTDIPPEDLALIALGAIQVVVFASGASSTGTGLGGRDVASRTFATLRKLLEPTGSSTHRVRRV